MSSSNGSRNNTNMIDVTLNGISVVWSDSKNKWGLAKGDGTGTALSQYYPGASANNMKDTDLVVTPKRGYKVKKIMVPCSYHGPYLCETWSEGYAFDSTFEINTHGSFLFRDLNSKYFSHLPSSVDPNNSYFILIELVPWDSEVYVEYDYGNIDELMDISKSSFEKAGEWLDSNESNDLGIGTIQTDSTQFKYAYNSSLTGSTAANAAANWKHYAHTISDEAKKQAADAGYYFAGWAAEYYTEANITQNTSDSYNNYTYNLSELHGTGEYAENEEVILASNLRLTAQWEPIKLNITKEVVGLDGTSYENDSHTYGFILQEKDDNGNWIDYGEKFYIDVIGDGSNSKLFSPFSAGTYRVVEVEGNDTLQKENNPNMFVSVYDKEEFEVSTENNNIQTTVINSYTESISIDVLKVWEDNNNSYNIRPASIIVELLQNDIPIMEIELNSENSWKNTFKRTRYIRFFKERICIYCKGKRRDRRLFSN